MVKTLSVALVCALALSGQLWAQQIDIGPHAKPKFPKAQAVAPVQPKADPQVAKAVAVTPVKAPEKQAAVVTTASAPPQKTNTVPPEPKKAAPSAPTAAGKTAVIAGVPAKAPDKIAAKLETPVVPKAASVAPVVKPANPALKSPASPKAVAKTESTKPALKVEQPTAAKVAAAGAPQSANVAAAPASSKTVVSVGPTAAAATATQPAKQSPKVELSDAPKGASTAKAEPAKIVPKLEQPVAAKVAASATAPSLKIAPKVEVPAAPKAAAIAATQPAAEKTAALVPPVAVVKTASAPEPKTASVEKKKNIALPKDAVVAAPPLKKQDPVATVAHKVPATAPEKAPASLSKPSPDNRSASIAASSPLQPRKEPVTKPAAAQSAFVGTSAPQPVSNHYDTAFTKLADGFDFAVGKPDAQGYYKARGFRAKGHLGEDWDGVGGGDTDLNDPIYSIADGVVVFARDCHMGWGNVIIVRHSYREGGTIKNVDALYGHVNTMLVRRGQAVARGQKIATIGTAHGLYDAHLHLEIRKNIEIGMSRAKFAKDSSNYYDPTQFIQARRTLRSGGGNYRVAMNTFTRDTHIKWDKMRNYSSSRHRGGTSESAAALKKTLAAKR